MLALFREYPRMGAGGKVLPPAVAQMPGEIFWAIPVLTVSFLNACGSRGGTRLGWRIQEVVPKHLCWEGNAQWEPCQEFYAGCRLILLWRT